MAKRIMRSFKLHEISAVDRPAQEGARFTIMKRADDLAKMIRQEGGKYCVYSEDGSKKLGEYDTMAEAKQRLAQVESFKREFSQEQRDSAAASGAAMPDGSFPIKSRKDLENAIHDWGRAGSKPSVKDHIISRAKSLGATDLLPDDWKAGKSFNEVDMTEDELKKKIDEAVTTATADLKKQLDEANKKLTAKAAKKPATDAEDAADNGDDEAAEGDAAKAKKRFDAAVAAEVAKRIDVIKGDESVVYNGKTIRKSEAGASFEVIKALVDESEINTFVKRADAEIGGLPGEQVAKAKALRSIAKLDEDTRKTIEAMLKAGNAAIKQGMTEIGKGGVPATDAEDEFNKQAEAYGKAHDIANKYVAKAKFLDTAEGKDLYKRIQDEKSKAA